MVHLFFILVFLLEIILRYKDTIENQNLDKIFNTVGFKETLLENIAKTVARMKRT